MQLFSGGFVGPQLVVEIIHHLWWLSSLHVRLQFLLFHDQGLYFHVHCNLFSQISQSEYIYIMPSVVSKSVIY